MQVNFADGHTMIDIITGGEEEIWLLIVTGTECYAVLCTSGLCGAYFYFWQA